MNVQKLGVLSGVIGASLFAAACSAPHGNGLSCGQGTSQLGNECVPVDAGLVDAERLADAEPIDAPADAAVPDSESSGFAIDPAHDNAQPTDRVASPLAPLWSAMLPGHVSYPLVVGGLVIVSVAGSQPTVRALDLHTGALVWGPIAFGKAVKLAYDRGQVFALELMGNLTALDAATGQQNWAEQVLGEVSFFETPPVASGGLIYVDGFDTETVALDEGTGKASWLYDLGEANGGCVAVGGGAIYESSGCNTVIALDPQTGAKLWSHSGNCTGGSSEAPATYNGLIWNQDVVSGSLILNNSGALVDTFASGTLPALAGNTAFYNSNGTVSAVDIATDTIRWSFTGDGELCTAPVVAGGGGQVLVGSQSGNVYELDEATGSQRSVANVGAAVTCFSETDSMALAENRLVVPVGNGLVVF